MLAGAGLAFARAVGEFGSVVLISGNVPFKTEVASSWIYSLSQSDELAAAAAVSVVLVADRPGRAAGHRPPPATVRRRRGGMTLPLALAPPLRRPRLPGPAGGRPGGLHLLPGLPARVRRRLGRGDHARRPACPVADPPGGPHRRAPGHRVRRGCGPHPVPPPVPRGLAARRPGRPARWPSPRSSWAGPHPRLRQDRLVRQLAGRPRHPGHLLVPGHRDGLGHRGPPLRGPRGAPGPPGDRHRPGAGRHHPRRLARSPSSGGSPCPPSGAAWPTG